MWHVGVIHKLKRKWIPGNLLSLLTDFLINRKQRVILRSQSLIPKLYIGPLLGLYLNSKLFLTFISKHSSKVSRTIGLLRKCQQALPRPSLITIYKDFIRPYFYIIEMSYLIIAFIRSFNLFNVTLVWQQLELLEELPRKSSIKNLVSSHCNPEDGFENYLSSTK